MKGRTHGRKAFFFLRGQLRALGPRAPPGRGPLGVPRESLSVDGPALPCSPKLSPFEGCDISREADVPPPPPRLSRVRGQAFPAQGEYGKGKAGSGAANNLSAGNNPDRDVPASRAGRAQKSLFI